MTNDWKKVFLKDLGKTYGGLTNKTKNDFGHGKPYIPYLNIFENGRIDPKFLEYVRVTNDEHQNQVQIGDLFFTTSSETPDEVGMTSVLLDELEDTYLNSFCFGFRLHNYQDLLPEYAVYLFRGNTVRKAISLLAQGSTRYNLSKTILLNKLSLNLPPIPQQSKIAQILSSCDKVIEQTEKTIEKYQLIKKGMMQDLFTRGIDMQTKKLRTKYKDAPHLYKKTELGMIPKEWDIKRLETIISNILLGVSFRGTSPSNDNIPLIKMGNLIWGELVFDNLETIDRYYVEEKHILHYRDFLFNTRNTPELVGKTAIWENEYPLATYDNNILKIRFKKGYASPFINYYMSFGYGKNRLKSLVKGTTSVAAIYWADLANYKLPLADKNEQEAIIDRINSINHKIQNEQSLLSKYSQLKSGLMQDLLSGKVKVNVNVDEKAKTLEQ